MGADMTEQEIQRKLDELETKRIEMSLALERKSRESESVLENIRHSVDTMQNRVQMIVEPIHATRNKRNLART
jgi:hypothetical protein